MTKFLYRLGRASVRHRRLVLAIWVVIAVVTIGAARTFGGDPVDNFSVPGSEAQQAIDVLDERFPAVSGTSAQLVFATDGGTLDDGAAAAAVDAAIDDVRSQPDVGDVSDLRVSDDGRIAYADVQYTEPVSEIRDEAYERLTATADRAADAGVRLELGGELPGQAEEPRPASQEIIGLLAAVIVLLLAFGSVIAMGLPIGTAVLGLITSFSIIGLVSAIADVTEVAPILAAMIGLGVGIDYALFIVTRHREDLHAGMTVEESAGRAIATAGAAVVFAGLTVVIAITGLAIAGMPAVTVMGLMSSVTVVVMVAISLTLLPALLGFAGHRIDSLRLPWMGRGAGLTAGRETFWHRYGRRVTARPWPWFLGGLAVLVTLALPIFGLRLGMTDAGASPESTSIRQAYDLTSAGFGSGFNGPLLVAVELDGGAPDAVLGELTSAISADPGVESVAPPRVNADGTAAVVTVIPTTSPQDAATSALVHRLRDTIIPGALEGVSADAHVGGQTAMFIDMTDQISSRLPWFIGAVILLSVVLLTVVFRSIVVPLKAAVMNLLSIGAAYGVVVAIFQWGWLKGVFGVQETVPIVSFVPMLMFAILFGLSMDYEVFLLSRVREEYLHSRDNDHAVIEGIASTARVITSAALIMISVFAAFVLGDDTVVKMFGLGLATAIFVDATVVRVVLVPATMKLLGDRNWWLPGWLDRLLPRLDIEGGAGLPVPEFEPTPPNGPGPATVDREPALVD